MLKLIKNEMYKIFKQKTIYILWFLMIAFVIFFLSVVKLSNQEKLYSYDIKDNIATLENSLSKLDPESEQDYLTYLDDKTNLDMNIYLLEKGYEYGSFQYDIITNRAYELFYDVSKYSVGAAKSDSDLEIAKQKLTNIENIVEKGDWKYFVELDLQKYKEEQANLLEISKNLKDKSEIATVESQIIDVNLNIKALTYRLDYDISYGNSYRSEALYTYIESSKKLYEYENKQTHTFQEELQYKEAQKDVAKSEYIIEKGIDIDATQKENIAKDITMNFLSYFGLFIVIIAIFISGSIVSSEFSKGTIKLLLIRPFSRVKIIISKWITSFIICMISILILLAVTFLISGIMFGFSAFSVKPVIYNYSSLSVETIGYIKYFLIYFIYNLPYYLMYLTIAFCLSTLLLNTGAAVTISLFVYISSTIISNVTSAFNIKFLKYYLTNNIDFSSYIFGAPCRVENMSINTSILLYIIYFVLFVVISILSFKKRDIKNI